MSPLTTASSWPCPPAVLQLGRQFLRDSLTRGRIVLLPDRDADGLCAGSIVHRTFKLLGGQNIQVHFMAKGENVHQETAMAKVQALKPGSLIVLDQGSRGGPALLPGIPTLIIDHHNSNVFPEGATVVSSYGYEPVATSSMLAYLLCHEMVPQHAQHEENLGWLAAAGTMGDLGTSFSFNNNNPWSDLQGAITAAGGKKALSDLVSLINAPRRTAEGHPAAAWRALQAVSSAKELVNSESSDVGALHAARREVAMEVDRVARTPPKFSADGRLALLALTSPAQVHPLIATRWSRSLKGKNLVGIIAANDGYLPGKVNFAARRAAQGGGTKAAGGDINLISLLKEAVEGDENLMNELGPDFARGHAQATGGSVSAEVWPRLRAALGFDDGSSSKRVRKEGDGKEDAKKMKTLMQFGFSRAKDETSEK